MPLTAHESDAEPSWLIQVSGWELGANVAPEAVLALASGASTAADSQKSQGLLLIDDLAGSLGMQAGQVAPALRYMLCAAAAWQLGERSTSSG